MSDDANTSSPTAARWSWACAIGWCLAGLIALVVSLAGMTIDRSGGPVAGQWNLAQLRPFWAASIWCWIGLSLIWWLLRRAEARGAMGPNAFARDALIVGSIAIAARVAVLVTHEPALSDDISRYIFDGRNLASGLNPYLVIPADRAAALESGGPEHWPGERQIVSNMVYREMASPYLPMSQYVFGGAALLIPDRWTDLASSARLFRIVLVAIELAMITVLLRVLKQHGRSAWWAALYAWHPLPIAEIAGSGHQDIIGIALLAGALAAYERWPARTARWTGILALSSAVKPIAAPLAAFMLKGQPAAAWLRSLMIGAAVVAVTVAPLFVIAGDRGRALGNWRTTVSVMAEKWAHCGGVYEPVLFILRKALPDSARTSAGESVSEGGGTGWNLVQERWARRICVVILAVVSIGIYRASRDAWSSSALMMLALVLLSTTAHPWYLLWALALTPATRAGPSLALWVYSLTISFGYVVFVSGKGYAGGEQWTVDPRFFVAIYIPVMVAMALDLRYSHSKAKSLKAKS